MPKVQRVGTTPLRVNLIQAASPTRNAILARNQDDATEISLRAHDKKNPVRATTASELRQELSSVVSSVVTLYARRTGDRCAQGIPRKPSGLFDRDCQLPCGVEQIRRGTASEVCRWPDETAENI